MTMGMGTQSGEYTHITTIHDDHDVYSKCLDRKILDLGEGHLNLLVNHQFQTHHLLVIGCVSCFLLIQTV